jgi:hypothetical protein
MPPGITAERYTPTTGQRGPATTEAKGFGSSPPPKPEPKPKSKGQVVKDEAATTYERMAKQGAPEYQVLARPFGADKASWKSAGFVAVPRSERPEDAIFANEKALLAGLFKLHPALKDHEGQLEYGYRSKKFPSDAVRVAVKRAGKSANPVLNWLGSLTSPVNTDEYTG